MKLFKGLVVFLMFSILSTTIYVMSTVEARTKSKVLLIVNNAAGTKHDKALTKIMQDELTKKLQGVYSLETLVYMKEGKSLPSMNGMPPKEIIKLNGHADNNYLVYAELTDVNKDTHFNFVTHGKTIDIVFLLYFVDLKTQKYIYQNIYNIGLTEKTEMWFKGSGSVSKNAVRKTLYRAGEAISAHLPL